MLAVVCPVLHNQGPGPLEVSVIPVAKQVPVVVILGVVGNFTVTGRVAVPLQLVTVMVPALPTALLPCHNTTMLPVPWPETMVPKPLEMAQV